MLSAAASLGAIMLWDMDTGFSSIDKYSFSTNPYIKAGSLLATGMISCGVTSELDAGFALLSEHVEDRKDPNVAIAAAFGLGLGYAGKERAELYELLVPVVVDNTRPLEVRYPDRAVSSMSSTTFSLSVCLVSGVRYGSIVTRSHLCWQCQHGSVHCDC